MKDLKPASYKEVIIAQMLILFIYMIFSSIPEYYFYGILLTFGVVILTFFRIRMHEKGEKLTFFPSWLIIIGCTMFIGTLAFIYFN